MIRGLKCCVDGFGGKEGGRLRERLNDWNMGVWEHIPGMSVEEREESMRWYSIT